MEVIKSLIEQQYALFNVNDKKAPMAGKGWETQTCDELKTSHNMNSTKWGLRMGKQENGRYIMCLDFDICGKTDEITNERIECEYTKNKYEEYINIVDKEDGHYLSSTIGNANVLIDYTDVPKIREMAENIGSKFKIHEFEFLFGNKHQQVIPPSQTICKINKKLVRARAFKNDKPFYVLTEDSPIYKFVEDAFKIGVEGEKGEKKKKQFIKNEKEVIENNNTTEKIKEDKFTELLNDVIKNELKNGLQVIGWDDYFHIAGMLRTNNYDINVFVEWAKLGGTKEQDAITQWKSISENKSLNIHGLQNIAKKINEPAYKEWLIKHNTYISLEILDKGENDVAKNIKDELKKTLIFCNNKWFCLDAKTNLWSVIKIPYATIISHIQNKIDRSRLNTLEEKLNDDDKKKYDDIDKKFKDHYKKLTCGSYSSQISKLLQEYLHDSNFENKLDTIPYKMAYKNGIMDLKTSNFRNGILSTDYLTRTIQYDYKESTKEEQEEVKKELLKICNMNSGHLDYYLSSLGYALTGDASRLQQFYAIRGQSASNGKSVIFEALTKILPNYVLKLESNIMELNYGSRHKEVATWKGVRVAWINELSRKKQDENEIKNLSDGTALRFKVNYGEMDTMPITLKLFIVSNNTLNINADAGIARRLKMMQFNSQFIDGIEDNYETCEFEKKDNFIKDLCTKYKYALMDLLYCYSKIFVNDNYKLKPYPKEWQEDSNDVVNDNNELHQYLKDNLEFGLNLEAGKREVDEVIASFKKEIKMADFKDALSSLKINYKYDSQKGYAGGKGKWTGFRVI